MIERDQLQKDQGQLLARLLQRDQALAERDGQPQEEIGVATSREGKLIGVRQGLGWFL